MSAPVEYRTKTEPPTEVGWHYGRRKINAQQRTAPQFVYRSYNMRREVDEYLVTSFTQENGEPTMNFDWFGPVTEVREG